MTETEWLAATDPTPMLRFLESKASDRKLILFCLYCCPLYGMERANGDPAYDTAMRYAEFGDVGDNRGEVRLAWGHEDLQDREATMPEDPEEWARLVTDLSLQSDFATPPREQAPSYLREIFGNPFRPVAIDPLWLTSNVVALAEGIYQDRAFDRMLILADALQDAGCDNEDVLNHCRQPGEHVRGCWVVDLILGKS